jgi:FG-GAP-like repeat
MAVCLSAAGPWFRCFLVALGATLAMQSAAHGATSFFDPEEYEMASPHVAVGDLNGDGLEDLVSAGGDEIGVRLGDGEGGLGELQELSTGGSAAAGLAIGDVDGDDHPDLVVSDSGDGEVLRLPGQGDGTFGAATSVASIAGAAGVVVGDFDGDDDTDVAVADTSSDEVALLLQGAGGALAAGATLDVGDEPASLDVGDVDGNGLPDLVTANRASADISVLLQRPAGFDGSVEHATGDHPGDVEIADLNGGSLEVAVVDEQEPIALLFRSTPAGALEPPEMHPTGSPGRGVESTDLDGDADGDLVVTTTSESLAVLIRGSNGALSVADGGDLGFQPSSGGLALGDFDADGEADLIVGPADGAGVGVAFGNVLTLEPGWLDFGFVNAGATASRWLAVRNTGSRRLAPGAIGFEGPAGPFSVESNGCAGQTLATRDSCSLLVRFSAPVETGEFEAFVRVAGDGASGPRFAYVWGVSQPVGHETAPPRTPRSPRTPRPPRTPRGSDHSFLHPALDRVARGLPRVLRGGRAGYLYAPALHVTRDGRLRMRLELRHRGRWIPLAYAQAKLLGLRPHRLLFSLTRRGRLLLRRPKPSRVRATLSYAIGDAKPPSTTRVHQLTVRPPLRSRR